MKTKMVLLSIICASAFISCASVTMSTQEGFVRFDKEKNFRAASPESVYIKTSIVTDKGAELNADLDTWLSEMSRSLSAKGYTFILKSDITTAAGAGKYCEYEVIFNGDPYTYAVVVSRKGDTLFFVETGGRKDLFAAQKTKIMNVMKTADLK